MPYPCCCRVFDCTYSSVVVDITGVTNGTNCTDCFDANDTFVLTAGSSDLDFTTCGSGTHINQCGYDVVLPAGDWSCSGSFSNPIISFRFIQVTGGDIYAVLQVGDDIGNDTHVYYKKLVSSANLPVTFTSADLSTTSPCITTTAACNFSVAEIVVSEP